jgi:pyruvate-ferredoxin/flavodoxin oxidoreductase
LGAFFRVSPFLKIFDISEENFSSVVRHQYEKKFGRFGEAVVNSNMEVMEQGFSRVQEILYGNFEDPDRSSMRNPPIKPIGDHQIIPTAGCKLGNGLASIPMPAQQTRAPFQTLAKFDSEFRGGFAYHQPAGAFASVGVMGAGSGATQSKYVARRETPVYIAENCTQCMECITACPDTALPNAAQDVATVLRTAAINYISNPAERKKLLNELKGIEERARVRMNEAVKKREKLPFKDIIRDEVNQLASIAQESRSQFIGIIDLLPLAYSNVPAIFRSLEQKTPGAGGLF